MMQKPNVLFIMTDQQRWDSLGCYDNSAIETPNLDWLASLGTKFSRAYSCTPSCIPARATLLTGMNPWNTGILGTGLGQGKMGGGFAHTLPGELARHGYHTQAVGKLNFSPRRLLNGFHNTVLDESSMDHPGIVSDYLRWFHANKTGDYGVSDHGIDRNSWMARPYHAPEFLHPTNWTVNESIRFLQERDPSLPFFLMTSFQRPHSPYDAPAYYFHLYETRSMPEPYIGDWSTMNDVPEQAMDPNAWRGRRSAEEVRRARIGYYGSISHIDHQIGRLLSQLKKMNQWSNTLIIFTSDHGDMLGDHHLWRKTYAYEGSAHIPLIIKLPDSAEVTAVSEVYEPVCLQDVMPTILDAVGLKIPTSVDGCSLLPLIRNEPASWREFVHGEHCTCYSDIQEMQYLTDGRWKYIWFPRTGSEQLFDLGSDPGELHDLAEDLQYLEQRQTWRERLILLLEPRNAGLVAESQLVCQAGRPPIVSPEYKERINRWHSNSNG